MQRHNPELLIWDLEELPCALGKCKQLSVLLRKVLPTARIYREESLPPSSPQKIATPDIVFVRITSTANLSERTSTLRKRYSKSTIIGVFCLNLPVQGNNFPRNVSQLDDFIACPFDEFELIWRLERVGQCMENSSNPAGDKQVNPIMGLEGLIGVSQCFLQVVEKIPKLSKTDATVLIEGETGTGKELFARAIHYCSPRSEMPFLPINCGALPDHLFENELFGHAKGAFTDASSEQKGLIYEAEGGTLFLDEVDSLSPASQVRLLRFLEDHEYRPLGSPKSFTANVRILAATNRDLKALSQKKQFREDLYYRFNIFCLHLPPLRDRLDDLPVLAEYFLARATQKAGNGPMKLSTPAIQKLLAYPWAGNIRELEAVIQRTMTFCDSQTIQAEELDISLGIQPDTTREGTLRNAKKTTIELFERNFLLDLLAEHQGNVSHAAKAAGKERRTFQRLLKKHHIDRHIFLNKT